MRLLWTLRVEQPTITAVVGARGGCDGFKIAGFGFHTGRDEQRRWRVHLGAPQAIERVTVLNRCDWAAFSAARLMLPASGDGRNWQELCQHNGRIFSGFSDAGPLIAGLKGGAAQSV
ncbi:MAG TPA: hypothetical protein VM098_02900, partial [Phycisphaerae bacterium]|nr:hypothetical protein [Phycisphaerae bacterium]